MRVFSRLRPFWVISLSLTRLPHTSGGRTACKDTRRPPFLTPPPLLPFFLGSRVSPEGPHSGRVLVSADAGASAGCGLRDRARVVRGGRKRDTHRRRGFHSSHCLVLVSGERERVAHEMLVVRSWFGWMNVVMKAGGGARGGGVACGIQAGMLFSRLFVRSLVIGLGCRVPARVRNTPCCREKQSIDERLWWPACALRGTKSSF